ncbi:MAG TPA: transcriptional regulator NrdR [Acidimicrobiales bacterium]|nr:transcriptional regulator NrdR [Acidimicrobiales bacterium]
MRCPWCGVSEDKVVDSREVEQGDAIRRRRECLACGRRFTTLERRDESVLFVLKRSGQREPFSRKKLIAGVKAATKNRPVAEEAIEALAAAVEEGLRSTGPEVSSEQVGLAVLDHLRDVDEVGYLRFASVYKGFEGAHDFQREVGLLSKQTDPKTPRS